MKQISIITINFNDCVGLSHTLASISNQDKKQYELIVIDGGSTDGSVDVIKQYSDYISYWVSEPDKGIYNAMNKGLKHCSGVWLFFLNAGDVFYNNHVLSSIDFSAPDENVGAIYGRYQYYTRYDELVVNEVKHPFTESKNKYRSMGFSHQSVFVRTNLAKLFGFDESFRLCADYNMMMQIYQAGYKFVRDNTIISICDGRGGASSKNRHLQDLEQARVCGCDNDIVVKIQLEIKDYIRPLYRFIKHLLK